MKRMRIPVVLGTFLVAGFFTAGCTTLRQNTAMSASMQAPHPSVAPPPLDIQATTTALPKPIVVPITIRAETQSPKELSVPIALRADTSTVIPIAVSLKITNVSPELVVIPVKIQFETNSVPLTMVLPSASTNPNPSGYAQAIRQNTIWPHTLPFWAMVLSTGLILASFIFWQLRAARPNKTLPPNSTIRKTQAPLDKGMPARALCATCAIIAAIHLYNSSGKADFVLVGLVALSAAPWMGRFFKKIGKEGIEFNFQGEAPAETALVAVLGAGTTPAPETAPAPGTTPTPPAVGAARARPPTEEEVRRIAESVVTAGFASRAWNVPVQIEFNSLRYEEKKVLGTLWKYQKLHFPGGKDGRWTFTVGPGSPDYLEFSIGFIELVKKTLAELAPNGQVMLSNKGFAFCQEHDAYISSWTGTYDRFSN